MLLATKLAASLHRVINYCSNTNWTAGSTRRFSRTEGGSALPAVQGRSSKPSFDEFASDLPVMSITQQGSVFRHHGIPARVLEQGYRESQYGGSIN